MPIKPSLNLPLSIQIGCLILVLLLFSFGFIGEKYSLPDGECSISEQFSQDVCTFAIKSHSQKAFFSRDGNSIIFAEGSILRLEPAQVNKSIFEGYKVELPAHIYNLTISPDRTKVAIFLKRWAPVLMEFVIFDAENLSVLKTIPAADFANPPSWLEFSPDGNILAGCRREIFQPTFALFCLIFAPLMGLLEQNLPNYWAKTEHFGSLIVLSDKLLAYDKDYLNLGTKDVEFLEWKNSLVRKTLIRAEKFKFSPDGKSFAVLDNRIISLFSYPSLDKIREFTSSETPEEFDFSPDGSLLASNNFGGKVIVWNVQNGQLIDTVEQLESLMCNVKFSSDNRLFSCSYENQSSGPAYEAYVFGWELFFHGEPDETINLSQITRIGKRDAMQVNFIDISPGGKYFLVTGGKYILAFKISK